MAAEVHTFSKKKQEGSRAGWYYAGEMIQKHGIEEFERFKKQGKFETREDKDGDTQYRKVREYEDNSTELLDSARVGKKCGITADEAKKLEDAMADKFKRKRSAQDELEDGHNQGGGRGGHGPRGGRGGRGGGRGRGTTEPLVGTEEKKAIEMAKKMIAILDKKADSLCGVVWRLKSDQLKKSIAVGADKCIPKVEKTKAAIEMFLKAEPFNHSKCKAAVCSAGGIVEEASKIIKAAK